MDVRQASVQRRRKPTLDMYEMICFYFSGLASEKGQLAHIEELAPQA